MAIQVSKPAKPDTCEADCDSGGYGQGQFRGASSDTPGQRTRAPLTVNSDDSDPALNAVKRGDYSPQNDPMTHTELRDLAHRGRHADPAYGMKPATDPATTPKVPGITPGVHDHVEQKPPRK